MRNRIFAILIIIGSLGLLAACGGGSTVTAPAGNDNQQITGPQSGQDPGNLDTWAGNQDLTETPVLYRGIPPVPVDGEQSTSQAADGDFVVLGSDALDYSQCEISGTAIIINPGSAAASNPDDIPAWAMYRVSGLRDLSPLSLNVECQPADLGQQYSVAVADYTSLDWFWFGPTSLPELEADLTMDGHRFVTNIGNLYFLVVCGGNNTATHTQSTVVTGTAGGQEPPGAPARLAASKGDFTDGVALTWTPGEGADYYAVFRKIADMFDGNGVTPPPGDPTDPQGGDPGNDRPNTDPGIQPPQQDTWQRIGRSDTTDYFDDTALPGLVFLYKVRAINDAGRSAFSNIDEGWAFFEVPPPPPPTLEGIHGYVFGGPWRLDDNTVPPGTDPGGGDGQNYPPGTDPGVPPDGIWPDLMPLEGATLTITAMNADGTNSQPSFTTQSNADGFYQFMGVPTGVYVISAALDGWTFPQSYTFEVVVVDESQQFDFIGCPDDGNPWDPPDGIHGWVTDGTFMLEGGDPGNDPGTGPMPRMLPLPDVHIILNSPESDQIAAEAYTDEEGFYQITDIAPGNYIVSAHLDTWYFDPPQQMIQVGDPVPSIEVNFIGYRGRSDPPPPEPDRTGIFGTAWGDTQSTDNPLGPVPLAGVEITLSSYPQEVILAEFTTGDDGQFAFPDLPTGQYQVSASLDGWTFLPPDIMVELTADMPVAQVDFFATPDNGGDGSPPGSR